MTRAVIICHGNLAFELVATANRVLGKIEDVFAFSNDNLSPEFLYEQVTKSISADRESGYLFLVDVRGGNCWRVAKMLNRAHPNSRVISGVNLPMVVSFVTKRKGLSLKELAEVVEKDGRRGIVLE